MKKIIVCTFILCMFITNVSFAQNSNEEFSKIKKDFNESKKIEKQIKLLKDSISVVQNNFNKTVKEYSSFKNSKDENKRELSYKKADSLNVQLLQMNVRQQKLLDDYDNSLKSIYLKLLMQHKKITTKK